MVGNMTLPLEDGFSDVVGKAQRGLGLSVDDLAQALSLSAGEFQIFLQAEKRDQEQIRKLAQTLRLRASSLIELAENKYHPVVPALPPGFFQANTQYGNMTVNAYLVWDPITKLAAAFDTGADAGPLIAEIRKEELTLQDVFLTHTHGDHVAELDRLLEKVGDATTVHGAEAEPLAGAVPFQPGVTFSLGKLQVETRDTSGQSAGGTTYAIHGLSLPLSIVGDALFAGSVGGIKSDYPAALQRIREKIFSGQDNTLLACGHGPLTTVGQEKKHNPFFPGI